jgi:RNA polymerase sigma factor (sigma-70 family)
MPRFEPRQLAAHIRRIAPSGTEAMTDAELVGRYADHRDTAAFELLVWRHGPMVWVTCRRILRHHHDVEDAFQATFLALARNAKSIGTRQAIAGWLHRVAMNAALRLRANRRTTGLTDEVPARPELDDGELAGAVDEELDRLPNRMRAAFVLCCLEGLTSAEAALELGCPVGTVDSRLHAARVRLRDRLTRRGFSPGALTGLVLVVVPASTTMAAAIGLGAGTPPRLLVDTLASQVIRIITTRGKTMKAVTVTALAFVLTGTVWVFGSGDGPVPEPKTPPQAVPKAQPPVAPVGPGSAPGIAQVVQPVRPQQPGGVLGDWLGQYLAIEGIRPERGKIEAGALLVDTVNGKKLDKPVSIVIRTFGYPAGIFETTPKQRYVLKGYELGEMVGTPPAVISAAEEQGWKNVGGRVNQAVWHWRSYFVVLVVVEPKGIEIPIPK